MPAALLGACLRYILQDKANAAKATRAHTISSAISAGQVHWNPTSGAG